MSFSSVVVLNGDGFVNILDIAAHKLQAAGRYRVKSAEAQTQRRTPIGSIASGEKVVVEPVSAFAESGGSVSVLFVIRSNTVPLLGYTLDVQPVALGGAIGSLVPNETETNFHDARNIITAGGAIRDPSFSIIQSNGNGGVSATSITADLTTVLGVDGVNDVFVEVVLDVPNSALGDFLLTLGPSTAISDANGSAIPFTFSPNTIHVLPEIPAVSSWGAFGMTLLLLTVGTLVLRRQIPTTISLPNVRVRRASLGNGRTIILVLLLAIGALASRESLGQVSSPAASGEAKENTRSGSLRQSAEGPQETSRTRPGDSKTATRTTPARPAGVDTVAPRISSIAPDPSNWIVDDKGLTQVLVVFNEDVTIPLPASVKAWNKSLDILTTFTTSYTTATKTLAITFAPPINAERITIMIDYLITDLAGNELDGELTVAANTTFPSGDGIRGGQAVFRYNVLQGDANRDGIVDQIGDGVSIQRSLGLSIGDAAYDELADLNRDGTVNVLDVAIFRNSPGGVLLPTAGTSPTMTRAILSRYAPGLLTWILETRFSEAVLALPSSNPYFLADEFGNIRKPDIILTVDEAYFHVVAFSGSLAPLVPCGNYTVNGSQNVVNISGEMLSSSLDPFLVSDTVPPGVTILHSVVTCETQAIVTITGGTSNNVTDVNPDAYEISGPLGVFEVPATGGFGGFTADVPLVDNQVNNIFVTGLLTTPCGTLRGAPTATSIIRDIQPPELFIGFPAAGSSITTSITDVAGRVSDLLSGFAGLTVSIEVLDASGTTVLGTPVAAEVNEGIGTNGTFFAMGVPLAGTQNNTIRVTASDTLGNQAVRDIVVTQAPVAAGVARIERVVGGNAQNGVVYSVLAAPIVVKLFDSAGTNLVGKWVTFEVSRSDGRLGVNTSQASDPDTGKMTYQVQTNSFGEAQAFWRLGGDAGMGNNRVTVTATGISGTTDFCATGTVGVGDVKQINVGTGNSQIVEVGAPAYAPLQVWVNDGRNGVEAVPVTFQVTQGGGTVNGAASAIVNTTSTGHAAVDFVTGPNAGLNVIEASVAGLANPAAFVIRGIARDPAITTSFTGLVVDNGSQPIAGAQCVLVVNGSEVGTTPVLSDMNGFFVFANIPNGVSGAAAVTVDGATATHVGGNPIPSQSFPSLRLEGTVIPNAKNSLPTPVRLPRLDVCNRFSYSLLQDTILTINKRNPAVLDSDTGNPDYCIPGIDGLRLIVKAGSMSIDGTPASEGSLLMLNQVHHDDIPMPLPDGAAPPFAGTLYPPNATFDPPIAIEYPNMSGLPPGAIAYFLSFDHDSSKFEIVGTGSVIEDGSLIVTDPGSGFTHGGWYCNCPPYSVSGDCDYDPDDNNRCPGSCCGSSDRCCDGGACCDDPNRCCNSDNPCCGSPDSCCDDTDPCCKSADPCCNPDNPCCGIPPGECECGNCDDGNPCTEDTCVGVVCIHEPVDDCGDCGVDKVCFEGACVSKTQSLSANDVKACPGGKAKVTLTASCDPDCGSMSFTFINPWPYLSFPTPPNPVPCDGVSHERMFDVEVDDETPPGPYPFVIRAATGATIIDTTVTVNVEECVMLTFEGLYASG